MSDVIIGIDLGTTNSLVAICHNGVPQILTDDNGDGMVPSVVHWAPESKTMSVGSLAKALRLTDPTHTASSIKRFMGQGKKDLDPKVLGHVDTTASTDENVLISLGQQSFTAIQLSSEILKKLKMMAEKSLGTKVSKAVITVPAYFNDSQRTATKAAGTLAGLEVLRIVNEPTAASLAYGLDKKKQGLIAVYDLGGGTFDLSILKLHMGIFEVLATSGDTALGGDDFDNALIALMIEQIVRADVSLKPSVSFEPSGQGVAIEILSSAASKTALATMAETIKKELTNVEFTEKTLELDGKRFAIKITRESFEAAIKPLVKRTLDLATSALEDAALTAGQIEEIVMVGGSTRVPLVKAAVKEFFGRELSTSVNPDQVVALGAAIQADILAGKNNDMVLLDVVPLSLGIETYGGTVGKLIHRNTKIPSVAQETFTTHVEGQRNVLIHVLQGERELAGDCRSLARFNLTGLPPMPAGLPKIQVTFLIDANGILTVKALELATQTASQIEVRPSYGMTDEQVEKMLEQSFEFAEADLKNRQLIDTRVEAEGVLNATERILKTAGDSLDQDTLSQIRTEIETVRILMAGEDYLAIRNALEKLENAAKPLAENVMNQALQGSLKQKHVDDI